MSEAATEDGLIRLADYTVPEAPTRDSVQRLLQRLRLLFNRDRKSAVADDSLDRASQSTLEDYLDIPDCEIVSRELRTTLEAWSDDDHASPRLRVLIMPPCESRGLIERFAHSQELQLLVPPPRARIGSAVELPQPALDGEGLLVIPRLESWFLRHRRGLDDVRELLRALAASERRCLICTNAWAWTYLVKAVRMDLLVPEPLTIRPFDALRLRGWLLELHAGGDEIEAIRSVRDGEDVMAVDESGELRHDFLKELAARSHGIPWVAWQLWRRALRTRREEPQAEKEGSGIANGANGQADTDSDAVDQGDTLWVVHEPPMQLPMGYEHDSRLLLHAILIHDCLAIEQLADAVPLVSGVEELVRAMLRSGLIVRDDERDGYRCLPSAYPTVRRALDSAGYPMPEL